MMPLFRTEFYYMEIGLFESNIFMANGAAFSGLSLQVSQIFAFRSRIRNWTQRRVDQYKGIFWLRMTRTSGHTLEANRIL